MAHKYILYIQNIGQEGKGIEPQLCSYQALQVCRISLWRSFGGNDLDQAGTRVKLSDRPHRDCSKLVTQITYSRAFDSSLLKVSISLHWLSFFKFTLILKDILIETFSYK